MQNIGRRAFCATLTLIAGLVSSASWGADEAPIFNEKGAVAFVGYSGTVSRWNEIDFPVFKKWMAVYAPNIEVKTYDPQGNAANQVSMAKSALVSGANALAIAAFQDAPNAILSAAHAAKVPVLLYIFIPNAIVKDSVAGLVGTDPAEIGKAQGQYVLDHAKEGSRIAIVNGDLSTTYARLQHEGMLSVLQPAFDSGRFKLLADRSAEGWLTAKAQAQVSSILTANRVDVLIMGNDDMAQGALPALRTAGLEKKVMVIGQDGSIAGLRAILQGTQTATAYRNLYYEAQSLAAATAYRLADKPVPDGFYAKQQVIGSEKVPFRPTPVTAIDRSNIDLVIKDGMATREQLCQGMPSSVGAPCN
ncbi:substrate-binding domain-containing protein [Mesorhizobium silamurunense]|uniref:substrate-binding domain-containing protein n=1 Tax=Mesorhizobium silamurunense TaxID=499528 RepID=UPI00177E3BC6|nr:substrate-binding domain-containing protein [Mesorhizobium silamurunense]